MVNVVVWAKELARVGEARGKIANLLENRKVEEAARVARSIGDRHTELTLYKSIGKHSEVVRLLRKGGRAPEAVKYCDSVGMPNYAVGLALDNKLNDLATDIALDTINRHFKNPESRHLDFSPNMVDLALKMKWNQMAQRIAAFGTDYFMVRYDFYTAARLQFKVGNLGYAKELMDRGFAIFREDGKDYKKLKVLELRMGQLEQVR